MNTNPRPIIVGMSGGVDSSVTAFLLKEAGYAVHGVFMKNWEADDTDLYCHSAQDVYDAKKVADTLGVSISSVNFSQTYWDTVFTHFLAEYQAGRTPNPDILCNSEIKFKAFLEHAKSLGANKIATGHYAKLVQGPQGVELHKALDLSKDQSYFLHRLNQAQLAAALFPLGDYLKTQVREIAKSQGFINAEKKDSTGICFIGERKFKTFLQDYLPAKPGDIITLEGKVIGQHEGLMYYTLGQRQGLNIGGRAGAQELPWYVAQKNLATNELVVVQGIDHPALLSNSLTAQQVHWITPNTTDTFRCTAKTRYRQVDQACQVECLPEKRIRVTFDLPQRAITPGQSVVFYQDTHCLGGAIIE